MEQKRALRRFFRRSRFEIAPSADCPPAALAGSSTMPASTVPAGCALNSNEVTTPKLPPPPRIAQNRSSFSRLLSFTLRPSASTTSAHCRSSVSHACARASRGRHRASGHPRRRSTRSRRWRRGHTVEARHSPRPNCNRLPHAPWRRRVDRDGFHGRQIDHDAVVAHGISGHVVTGAAYGKRQVVLACKTHNPCHVVGIAAARDQRWTPVDRDIKTRFGIFIARTHVTRGVIASARVC